MSKLSEIEEDSRIKCKEKFQELLEYNDVNDADEIADTIEKGVFDYVENFDAVDIKYSNLRRFYMNKIISLYTNLNPKSYVGNTTLLTRLVDGEIKPSELACMTSQQIFPERWQKLIDRKNAKDEFLYSKTFVAKTNEFKCGKCKKNECTYYQMQIRSADEPMTTFVTCLECGNKWHF